jgi:hypothetical protein
MALYLLLFTYIVKSRRWEIAGRMPVGRGAMEFLRVVLAGILRIVIGFPGAPPVYAIFFGTSPGPPPETLIAYPSNVVPAFRLPGRGVF